MSYGPPPTPPTPNPAPRTPSPTPPPTSPSTAPPTTLSPTTFSPTTGTSSPTPKSCCEPESLRDLILTKLYDGDDAEVVFRSSPQKDAIEWLEQDVCDCSRESCLTDDRLVQRYILAVLYYSTNGSSWPACSKPEDIESTDTCQVQSTYGVNIITISDDVKVSEGFRWLTCNTECEWSGANCNNKNELGVIDMEKNIPGGNLPTEVGSLSKLLVLALEQSNLQGVIPTSYEKLTKLQILDFDFNILSGELIDLSRLTKLQQLDLNNNNLSGSIVTKGWQNLTVLQFVDLSYNEFTGQIPVEIGGLTTLRELYKKMKDGQSNSVTHVNFTTSFCMLF